MKKKEKNVSTLIIIITDVGDAGAVPPQMRVSTLDGVAADVTLQFGASIRAEFLRNFQEGLEVW